MKKADLRVGFFYGRLSGGQGRDACALDDHWMKVAELLKLLRDDGWVLVATRGSHRQFKHPRKPGRVTIAGKASEELAPGTLGSILKQAALRK